MDVHLALLGHAVSHDLHSLWQVDAQAEGVKVSDAEPALRNPTVSWLCAEHAASGLRAQVPDMLNVLPLLAALLDGGDVQAEPGHVAVLLEAQHSTHFLLICQPVQLCVHVGPEGSPVSGHYTVQLLAHLSTSAAVCRQEPT